MNADELRRRLEYYRDLGIKDLYTSGTGQGAVGAACAPSEAAIPQTPPPVLQAPVLEPALPPMAPQGDSLLQILQDIGDCRRCRLHEGRNKIVFGVGSEQAPLVFVGEGPAADEDEQGI